MYHYCMQPTLPESLQRGFRVISELDEDQMARLLSVLKTEQPSLDPSALASKIASELNISRRDASTLLGALTANYTAKVRSGRPASAIAEAILRAVDNSRDETLQLSGEERDRFKARFTQLLSFEAFDAAAKASDVAYEHEHVIQSARILTDIRPAYVADPPEPPAGAVIVHMLKIEYLEGEEVREFFIALDTDDVDNLIRTLEHAKAKSESLKSVLDRAGIRYIDVR